MAPSRGFTVLLRARYSYCRPITCQTIRRFSRFTQAATNPSNRTQIYISRTLNPYLNLSIEHYLLQKTPSDSTILFLYTNRPCIVIGRNQNPWLEINLGLLRHDHLGVELVRRRSGGGTVFHDEGNVNYSIICPTPAFNRDKHAEMVVRALKKLGVHKAKVNERHDIVLENGPEREGRKELKVSGSAYKLTRLRSLHHGTCLLSSPNLGRIGSFLRSPAREYIKARGVDSVSSPIANVNVLNADFEEAVVEEFGDLYENAEAIFVADNEKEVPDIKKGFDELTSLAWIYQQTPQFTFSTHAFEDDPRERPPLPSDLYGFGGSFTARNGIITKADFAFPLKRPVKVEEAINGSLTDRKLHEIHNWSHFFWSENASNEISKLQSAASFMTSLLGNGAFVSEEEVEK